MIRILDHDTVVCMIYCILYNGVVHMYMIDSCKRVIDIATYGGSTLTLTTICTVSTVKPCI